MKLSVRETRQQVLQQTLSAFGSSTNYSLIAKYNLKLWSKEAAPQHYPKVAVLNADWAQACYVSTKNHGTIHAVLNMANSIFPGGGYKIGCGAQEENLFRRSDCSLYDCPETYPQNMTDLLSASHGSVYLDTNNPRICIRGPENLEENDLGYHWLPNDSIFPFLEMRASALDLNSQPWNENECEKRIEAQFTTLLKNNIKHVILGAFGCGCFGNPPEYVAKCYKKQILQHQSNFDAVVFAIIGNNNNYITFKNIIPQL